MNKHGRPVHYPALQPFIDSNLEHIWPKNFHRCDLNITPTQYRPLHHPVYARFEPVREIPMVSPMYHMTHYQNIPTLCSNSLPLQSANISHPFYSNVGQATQIPLPQMTSSSPSTCFDPTQLYSRIDCVSMSVSNPVIRRDIEKANFASRRQVRRIRKNTTGYPCSQCTNTFTTDPNRTRHIRTVHEGKRPYACERCPLTFGQKVTKQKHFSAVHEKSRPFICSHCGDQFSREDNMKRHTKCHTWKCSASTAQKNVPFVENK